MYESLFQVKDQCLLMQVYFTVHHVRGDAANGCFR